MTKPGRGFSNRTKRSKRDRLRIAKSSDARIEPSGCLPVSNPRSRRHSMRWLRAMTTRGPTRLSGASSVSPSGGPSTVFSLPAGIFWILVVEPESMRRYLARAGLRVHATDISGGDAAGHAEAVGARKNHGPSDLRAEGAGGSRASERTRPIRRSHFKFRCDQLRARIYRASLQAWQN